MRVSFWGEGVKLGYWRQEEKIDDMRLIFIIACYAEIESHYNFNKTITNSKLVEAKAREIFKANQEVCSHPSLDGLCFMFFLDEGKGFKLLKNLKLERAMWT